MSTRLYATRSDSAKRDGRANRHQVNHRQNRACNTRVAVADKWGRISARPINLCRLVSKVDPDFETELVKSARTIRN